MSWPVPSTGLGPGQWGQQGVPQQMSSDVMNMGPYMPEQWVAMQQQNWQQWTQWQQQYSQWQNQFGDKYAEQMQTMPMMGAVPPPPPTTAAPPVPPPPDKPPPPPPHKNDQPLYAKSNNSTSSYNIEKETVNINKNSEKTLNAEEKNWSQQTHMSRSLGLQPNLPSSNLEALKKLAEEEKQFDKQFKEWEDEIAKWRRENLSHPDKDAYKQYEEKFESCREQLLERRQQMNLKRLRLTGNLPSASSVLNIQQSQPKSNFNLNSAASKSTGVPTSHSPHLNREYNYSSRDIPPQNSYIKESNNLPFKMQHNLQNNEGFNKSQENRVFLPSIDGNKGIPGLDLVSQLNKHVSAPQQNQELIDISDEPEMNQPRKPQNYTEISKGINSILGDEKIMNILTMVRDQVAPQGNKNNVNQHNYFPQQKFDVNITKNHQNNYDNNSFDDHVYRKNANRESMQEPGRHQLQKFDNEPHFGNDAQYNRNIPYGDNRNVGPPHLLNRGMSIMQNDDMNVRSPFHSNRGMKNMQNDDRNVGQSHQMNRGMNSMQNEDRNVGQPPHMIRGINNMPINDRNVAQLPHMTRGMNNMQSDDSNVGQPSHLNRGRNNMQTDDRNVGPPHVLDRNVNNIQNDDRNIRKAPFLNNGVINMQNDNRSFGPPSLLNRGINNMQNDEKNVRLAPQLNRGINNIQDDVQYQRNTIYGNNTNLVTPNLPHNQNLNERQFIRNNVFDDNLNRGFQPPGVSNTSIGISSHTENLVRRNSGNWSDMQPFQDKVGGNVTAVQPIIALEQKWIQQPEVVPSLIVDYEHKPLRLKARDFIEPVHTFDYNHKSKDEEYKSTTFDPTSELEIFRRKSDYKEDEFNKFRSQRGYDNDSRDFDRHRVSNRETIRDDFPTRGTFRDERRRVDDRKRPEERYHDGSRRFEHSRRPEDSRRFEDRRNDERRNDERRNDERRTEDRRRHEDNRNEGFHRRHERIDDRSRSDSKEKESRKREYSKEKEVIYNAVKRIKEGPKDEVTTEVDTPKLDSPKHIVMIDDLLEPPGRHIRPEKIAIILRGLPGSGKSYLAKLIRDREAEYGGSAKIMSIDDYFLHETETEETDPTTGKMVKKTTMKYEYDEKSEDLYLNSLKRATKRVLTAGYFNFIIYDSINEHLKSYADIWNFSRQNGFQVYICTMESDPEVCFKRNIHNRTLEEVKLVAARFFETPSHHIVLDATTLLQNAAIQDVDMEDVNSEEAYAAENETEVTAMSSKWDKMDDANQLAKLDGTNKPLRPSKISMEDYLQLDDWQPAHQAKPGKKTVRWADIEERRKQEKMRAIGFVVGQTDWNRMTDPTMGSSALTQTKYIERVKRI